MKVLAMDTSSLALTLALLEDSQIMAELTLNIKRNHSVHLMPAIDFLVESVGWKPTDLERIVVAEGPGSYTGLRVAVATAKTLAYALHADLVGVSSLYALASGMQTTGVVVPLMDARRNHVYAGFYENGNAVSPDIHLPFSEVLQRLVGYDQVTFVGEVENFRSQIAERLPRAQVKESLPSAVAIGILGQQLPPVEVDTFVPQYLKRVEAEENWLKTHSPNHEENYVKRV